LSGSEASEDWNEIHRFCLAIARRMTANPAEAEDVAQEAVLRAWRFRAKQRGTDRRPWLARIVRNEALRAQTRRQPRLSTDAADLGCGEDDEIVNAPQRVDISLALQRLEPAERLLLQLRYSDDLTQPAIARRLGWPEGTVKVRLHRARKKLRAVSEP
jgi:RNA polymerase sigma-70 factor, ECF subfamily